MHGNVDEKTMRNWRRIYHESLGKALVPLDAIMIGGAKGDVVVMDETVVGVMEVVVAEVSEVTQ